MVDKTDPNLVGRCCNLIIAVRVTFGPPQSAPVVFHARFIVFTVTFSFLLLEHDQLSKGRVVSQKACFLRSRKNPLHLNIVEIFLQR